MAGGHPPETTENKLAQPVQESKNNPLLRDMFFFATVSLTT
jgi:hypothetical protein